MGVAGKSTPTPLTDTCQRVGQLAWDVPSVAFGEARPTVAKQCTNPTIDSAAAASRFPGARLIMLSNVISECRDREALGLWGKTTGPGSHYIASLSKIAKECD